ncbi:hypothetical protein [uncultured Hymenobacter sp.]|uniref:hypothetical protein n=1 Tax=uncultured Hymenobacter sp. TaxID=170016 RepID=UPI0035CB3D18
MKIILTLKPALALAAALLLASSCISVKHAMSDTPQAQIARRLPPLEVAADNGPLASTDGAEPDDALRVLRRELTQNVVEPTDTATFGYAKLTVTEARVRRTNRGLQAVQMATLMLPSLLGVPLENYKSNVTVELQLLDAQGQEVGCYAGYGESNVRVAMYHGYSQTAAPRLSDVQALRAALARIRPQLDSAASRVRPRLLGTGPVDNPTLPAAGPTAQRAAN